eukprot:EG_transcript_28007
MQVEYYRQWTEYYRKWHAHYYGSPYPYGPPGAQTSVTQPFDFPRTYPPLDPRAALEQPPAVPGAEPQNNVVIWAMIFVTGLYILLTIEELTEEGAKPLPANSALRDAHLTQLRNRRLKHSAAVKPAASPESSDAAPAKSPPPTAEEAPDGPGRDSPPEN